MTMTATEENVKHDQSLADILGKEGRFRRISPFAQADEAQEKSYALAKLQAQTVR